MLSRESSNSWSSWASTDFIWGGTFDPARLWPYFTHSSSVSPTSLDKKDFLNLPSMPCSLLIFWTKQYFLLLSQVIFLDVLIQRSSEPSESTSVPPSSAGTNIICITIQTVTLDIDLEVTKNKRHYNALRVGPTSVP